MTVFLWDGIFKSEIDGMKELHSLDVELPN